MDLDMTPDEGNKEILELESKINERDEKYQKLFLTARYYKTIKNDNLHWFINRQRAMNAKRLCKTCPMLDLDISDIKEGLSKIKKVEDLQSSVRQQEAEVELYEKEVKDLTCENEVLEQTDNNLKKSYSARLLEYLKSVEEAKLEKEKRIKAEEEEERKKVEEEKERKKVEEEKQRKKVVEEKKKVEEKRKRAELKRRYKEKLKRRTEALKSNEDRRVSVPSSSMTEAKNLGFGELQKPSTSSNTMGRKKCKFNEVNTTQLIKVKGQISAMGTKSRVAAAETLRHLSTSAQPHAFLPATTETGNKEMCKLSSTSRRHKGKDMEKRGKVIEEYTNHPTTSKNRVISQGIKRKFSALDTTRQVSAEDSICQPSIPPLPQTSLLTTARMESANPHQISSTNIFQKDNDKKKRKISHVSFDRTKEMDIISEKYTAQSTTSKTQVVAKGPQNQAPAENLSKSAPAQSVPSPVSAEIMSNPAPAKSMPSPAPAESMPSSVPAESMSNPSPAETIPNPAPDQSVPSPVLTESMPSPTPAESLLSLAPSQSMPSIAPSESMQSPALSESMQSPAPSESMQSPAPTVGITCEVSIAETKTLDIISEGNSTLSTTSEVPVVAEGNQSPGVEKDRKDGMQ